MRFPIHYFRSATTSLVATSVLAGAGEGGEPPLTSKLKLFCPPLKPPDGKQPPTSNQLVSRPPPKPPDQPSRLRLRSFPSTGCQYSFSRSTTTHTLDGGHSNKTSLGLCQGGLASLLLDEVPCQSLAIRRMKLRKSFVGDATVVLTMPRGRILRATTEVNRLNTGMIVSDGLMTPNVHTLIPGGKGIFSQFLYHLPRTHILNDIVLDSELINFFELWSHQTLRMRLFDVFGSSFICAACWFNLCLAQNCTRLVEDPKNLHYHSKNQMQIERHIKLCLFVSPMPSTLSLLGEQSGIDESRCALSFLSKVSRSGKTNQEGNGKTFYVGSNPIIDVRNAEGEQGGPCSYAHVVRHKTMVLGQTLRPPAKPLDRCLIVMLALESYTKGVVGSTLKLS